MVIKVGRAVAGKIFFFRTTPRALPPPLSLIARWAVSFGIGKRLRFWKNAQELAVPCDRRPTGSGSKVNSKSSVFGPMIVQLVYNDSVTQPVIKYKFLSRGLLCSQEYVQLDSVCNNYCAKRCAIYYQKQRKCLTSGQMSDALPLVDSVTTGRTLWKSYLV
ncbi:hypothetical protein BJV82DRAFT_391266 [Fennellomyces sp. T-0311]|nr:hypothetical protein BJV82DRAFT_391266 [Fennellomyces sp. T-0311]